MSDSTDEYNNLTSFNVNLVNIAGSFIAANILLYNKNFELVKTLTKQRTTVFEGSITLKHLSRPEAEVCVGINIFKKYKISYVVIIVIHQKRFNSSLLSVRTDTKVVTESETYLIDPFEFTFDHLDKYLDLVYIPLVIAYGYKTAKKSRVKDFVIIPIQIVKGINSGKTLQRYLQVKEKKFQIFTQAELLPSLLYAHNFHSDTVYINNLISKKSSKSDSVLNETSQSDHNDQLIPLSQLQEKSEAENFIDLDSFNKQLDFENVQKPDIPNDQIITNDFIEPVPQKFEQRENHDANSEYEYRQENGYGSKHEFQPEDDYISKCESVTEINKIHDIIGDPIAANETIKEAHALEQIIQQDSEKLENLLKRVYTRSWVKSEVKEDPYASVARLSDLDALRREIRQEVSKTLESYVEKDSDLNFYVINKRMNKLEQSLNFVKSQQLEMQQIVSNLCVTQSKENVSYTADPVVEEISKEPLVNSFLQFMKGLELTSQLAGDSFRELQRQLHYPEAYDKLMSSTSKHHRTQKVLKFLTTEKATNLIQSIEQIAGILRAGGVNEKEVFATKINESELKSWWPQRPFA